VFHTQGFKGARTTAIAEAAGISRTMLHYYFSTKEALFQEVLEHTLGTVLGHLKKLLIAQKTLPEIIQSLIDSVCELLDSKPSLPSFIINIINTSPELLLFLPVAEADNLPALLQAVLEEEKKQSRVAPQMEGEELLLNIYALCALPYLSAPYIKVKENRSEAAMQAFLLKRRARILEFVLKGILP
jgi:AcrR family transcriptional regulator